ncbi:MULTISPECIES: NAD(P)H-dependent flavin oxidoreductase [Bradyrhizobium]|uniref:NAD(P)H-dependent flavin oxidoreductase n=1 Tax=Bradyrhizobium centrosematis TaxID=1300039 RepID=UPI0021688114|nr:nitronate monooxygenase [Bradyrhizobium centrosematis]MCS3765942.1 nitronate monooxygenase [Bradyrhizobium centrosematis]MCS3778348.1 nitronate monooxygenase [Bradyrhizobium centrosematis]
MTSLSESSRLLDAIFCRLTLPLIVAPMAGVSGVELVTSVCRSGSIGAFPTTNARSVEELDHWLGRIEHDLANLDQPVPPHCPSLMIRHPRFKDDLACLVRRKVEIVITSVGSPAPAIDVLHENGCLVFADIASVHHAEKAVAAGADGLILLTAGAGGHTGWANPFAFVRAVRAIFDGPIVLAGGIADGISLAAARVLGCELACMGTRFIATSESMASDTYRQMLVDNTLDDIVLTSAFWGLPANVLRSSIIAAGLDASKLDDSVCEARATQKAGAKKPSEGPPRWNNIFCAGHSVSGVRSIIGVAELVKEIGGEYEAALANARCTRTWPARSHNGRAKSSRAE